MGSPRPQVEVLFPIYGGGNGVCGAPPFCGSGGPFRVLWGLCPTSAPTPHVGGAGLGVPPPSGRGLRLAFLILWGLSPTSPIPPQIPSMGGAGLGVPPPPSGQGLRLAFLILWGLSPTSPIPPKSHPWGARGWGSPPPPSGRGLRLAFLILRGQYWGRCWGLSPTSPPIPPTGSAGLGVPPPSALGSDPPLWGRSAPTPPFRDPISPFCISSVQRTNRALFSATAFLSVPASPHGVWGCSGAEGSGWDRA